MAGSFILACSKKTESDLIPAPSVIPAIAFQNITPKSIKQFDDLMIYIYYQDGDGDIGDLDADELSLELVDERDSILHAFHVPPQSQIENIYIRGTLEIHLENIILLDQSNAQETITFKARLKDRAGNWSNKVTTPTITIVK